GQDALFGLTNGNANTANGAFALFFNQTGSENTASSYAALFYTRGSWNTANGVGALQTNATGNKNTANGGGRLVTIQWATTTRPTVFRRSVTTQLAVSISPWVIVPAAASARRMMLFVSGPRAPTWATAATSAT